MTMKYSACIFIIYIRVIQNNDKTGFPSPIILPTSQNKQYVKWVEYIVRLNKQFVRNLKHLLNNLERSKRKFFLYEGIWISRLQVESLSTLSLLPATFELGRGLTIWVV